jgi:hypothetical protein
MGTIASAGGFEGTVLDFPDIDILKKKDKA